MSLKSAWILIFRVLSSYLKISICKWTLELENILSVNPHMFAAFRDCRNRGFVSHGLFTTPVWIPQTPSTLHPTNSTSIWISICLSKRKTTKLQKKTKKLKFLQEPTNSTCIWIPTCLYLFLHFYALFVYVVKKKPRCYPPTPTQPFNDYKWPALFRAKKVVISRECDFKARLMLPHE